MGIQAALGLAFSTAYRDAAWIAATWWGNDLVTLLFAVPLLALAVILAGRGSPRGTLLWAGMLAFAAYNYAYYLLGAAMNEFFVVYVACVLLSAAALILLLASLDARTVAAGFRKRTPNRLLGAYFMVVATGLTAVWLGTWAGYAFTGRPTPVATEAFKLVAALDLTLMVPALGLGGYLLFRRRPWGYVISASAAVQASLYLLVLSVNSVVAIRRGLAEAPGELPLWGALLVLTTAATTVLLACVRTESPKARAH
jgi:hypothetical protein